MKKLEVKKIGVFSAFKVMIYMMIIPSILLLLFGGLFVVIGVISQQIPFIIMGVFMAIVYPICFLFVYSGFSALAALVYNFCAGKFGGLEVTVNIGDVEVIIKNEEAVEMGDLR